MEKRHILITTLLVLISISSYSQKKIKGIPAPVDSLYAWDIAEVKMIYPQILVKEMATPNENNSESDLLILKSIRVSYPVEARENGIQGTVYCRLLIDTLGNVFDIKVIKGIGGGCTEEALRALESFKNNPVGLDSKRKYFTYQKIHTDFILR